MSNPVFHLSPRPGIPISLEGDHQLLKSMVPGGLLEFSMENDEKWPVYKCFTQVLPIKHADVLELCPVRGHPPFLDTLSQDFETHENLLSGKLT